MARRYFVLQCSLTQTLPTSCCLHCFLSLPRWVKVVMVRSIVDQSSNVHKGCSQKLVICWSFHYFHLIKVEKWRFYFGCIMSNSWVYVRYTSIHSLFWSCIGFYSLAVVAWQKLRCITSSQVWSWHCAKKIARQPKVHLKHERMMLTGNLRQPSITSITGIV